MTSVSMPALLQPGGLSGAWCGELVRMQPLLTSCTTFVCTATTRSKYTQWMQCLCVQQPHAANTHSGHSACVYSNHTQQIHTADTVSACIATTDSIASVCTATIQSLSHLKGRCANNLPMVVKAPKNIQLCLCVF